MPAMSCVCTKCATSPNMATLLCQRLVDNFVDVFAFAHFLLYCIRIISKSTRIFSNGIRIRVFSKGIRVLSKSIRIRVFSKGIRVLEVFVVEYFLKVFVYA